MKTFWELKDEIKEVSQKTLDNYMKKARKQYSKAADKMSMGSDKAKKTFTKRHKGMGSVFKRDMAKKSCQSYVHKPSMDDRIKKGTAGHSLTTKPADKLAKSYKDR